MSTVYIRAEDFRVDSDEDGYSLFFTDSDSGQSISINIHGLTLEFYAAVQKEIRPYVLEAESARNAVSAGLSRAQYLGITGPPEDENSGYELDDPKHPTYHDRMVGDA